jgi:hypothetical protein
VSDDPHRVAVEYQYHEDVAVLRFHEYVLESLRAVAVDVGRVNVMY